MKKCGYCDNCLKQKNDQLTNDEFATISSRILASINGATEIKQLIDQLQGFKKEKIWKVIDYMQEERKVIVNENGFLEISVKQ